DLDVLEQVIKEIVRRHEVLRTRFEVEDGEPVQLVDEWKPGMLERIDLAGWPPEESQAEVIRIARGEARTGFDLSKGPLLRVKVLKLEEQQHVVLFTMHHIVSDGWSMGILIGEVRDLYRAYIAGEPSPLAELPIQYADFAVWQREYLTGRLLESEVGYWRERLKDAATLELPTDHARPAMPSHRGGSERIALGMEASERLRRLAQREGVTLFIVLMAAFKVILMRYSGEEDLSVGTVIANRTRKEIESLIGFFVNTLVLRTDLSGSPSFRELIGRELEVALGAYAHQEVPFEKLVEEINPERDLSRGPLFQVLMVLQNVERGELTLDGLKMVGIEEETGAAEFDLLLSLTESEEVVEGILMYSLDLFEAETIRRIARHYERLVEDVIRNADRRIGEIELMEEAEKRQIVEEWNETETVYEERRLVHEIISEQAGRREAAIAVRSEEGELSYRELEQRSNQLAHYLRSKGVKGEDVVAICAERSLEMVIAILGVLKAGAAYLPVDTADPRQRIELTLADAQARLLLTQERLLGLLEWQNEEVVCLDRDWEEIGRYSGEAAVSEVREEGMAYVIYTSGSTGRPKGVMNTHEGIRNRLLWMQEKYGLEESDRVLQKTTFSFDVSVWELLWPLMSGAVLVMARVGGQKDSEYLLRAIKEEEITTIHFVPSMLRVFLEERIEEVRSLRRVLCSGEALTKELEEGVRRRTQARVSNLYGPTEAAIDVSWWENEGEEEKEVIPIGKPIANIKLYVLDGELEAVPVGVRGEIYIGGVGLARGYQRRAELTAERFVPHRLSGRGGERLYRTGDVGRYLADGNIEYLGRTDEQVKVRGYRIELGEIEAALNAHRSVKQSAVVTRDDGRGGKRLIGYVVFEEAVTVGELKRHVRERLPEYMVPETIVVLEEIPLTASGKLDRRRLPVVNEMGRGEEQEYVAPRTPVEEIVCGFFGEVLKRDRIGVEDNFFEMGGHSLLATQVISRVKRRMGVGIGVRSIFEGPTAAGLARRIEDAMRAGEKDGAPPLVRATRDKRLPLSFAQQRLWFLDQLAPNNPFYNNPGSVRLEGRLDLDVLEQV
ncbi:MAG: amino acid adenylation domain-containing protein, partial [Ktedonobacteraceae bacterium]|nr:amino acid adenylation domain-containing protein [Ktedonobacteraceae bacterium]